jgi:hypothetical protein
MLAEHRDGRHRTAEVDRAGSRYVRPENAGRQRIERNGIAARRIRAPFPIVCDTRILGEAEPPREGVVATAPNAALLVVDDDEEE